MPSIVMPKNAPKDATAKDPSVRAKIGPFLAKLAAADSTAGLHVEPIRGTQDPRVRTARVDSFYRAILFQIDQGEDAVYVFHGMWAHDEAIREAKQVTLKVNPRNGATEVTRIANAVIDSQESVEEARRRAQERLAAAQREAQEITGQAVRFEETNKLARRQLDELTHPTVSTSKTIDSQGAGEASQSETEKHRPSPVVSSSSPVVKEELAAGTTSGLENVNAVFVPMRDRPLHWPEGLTVEVLRDELGLEVGLAAAALAAKYESQLLDLALTAEVAWHGDLLLSLATGSSIDDVRKEYELQPPAEVSVEGTDEDLLAGLRTRAARSVFTWAENDEDLRLAIENLSFQQWQIFLHPQQRALVECRTNGAMRISGGAGTGKTVVIVHRAKWLADRDNKAGKDVSILLTTFTRNLAEDLRRQVGQLAPTIPLKTTIGGPGIVVANLDALARSILQRADGAIADASKAVLGRRCAPVLSHNKDDKIWREVVAMSENTLPKTLCSADFLASEYELVILPQHVTTLQAYLRVRRPGRGVALDRVKRAAVWKAVETYRDLAASQDIISFPERCALAAAWLDHQHQAGKARPFRHVIVDEAQDLSPAHLLLLRALVEPGPDDLFLAEDSHQRIYGKKITLSHYGIHVRGRSRRLTRNYRTTRQNLDLAFGVLEAGSYQDMEGQPEEHHYVSPRSGPEPMLVRAANRSAELDETAKLIRQWLVEDKEQQEASPETIAVLVRDRYQRDAVVAGLAERGVETRPVDREAVGRGRPVVMTMHRAKGLEFRKVLLFDVSASTIPRPLRDQEYSDTDKADALLRERSLLYVAATRARDQLAISWSGEPSPLLESLMHAS